MPAAEAAGRAAPHRPAQVGACRATCKAMPRRYEFGVMSRNVIAVLGLIGLGLLTGCPGGGNTALTTVPTAHLAITLAATTVTTGTPFTFTVTAVDATNIVVPTYLGTVHITTSDTSAILPADATLARGVGTFAVTFSTTGSQTITASDTVGDATSGTSPAVSVQPIPAPTVTSLSPTRAVAGDSGFTLTVNGSNLEPSSVVQWNGSNRSTVFVNGSQVTAQISATDIATPGTAAVTVFNPAPGGGSSNTSTFTVTTGTCGGLAGGPQSIAVDRTGQFAYVARTDCTLAYAGHVSMYAVNATAGTLTSIGQPVPTQDEGAISVAVDPAGKFAYVANWGGGDTAGSVSTYNINATTGALTSIATIQAPCAPPPSPGSCAPFSVAVHPSGKFVYAANEGGFAPTSVSMYIINATTGALTLIGTTAVGGRATSVAVDPKGMFAYVTTESDPPGSGGNVSIYTINASTGALTPIGTIAAGTDPVSVAVDPAGKFTYVTNATSNNVSMYTINAATGGLTSVGTAAAGTNPASVAVSPTGKFAYATNSGSNDVSMYTINGTTGVLTPAGTIAAGSAPTSIAIHPSGGFAYVTNSGSNNVSVYSIDAGTGALALVATIGT
jgi:6-phosphogluconolactonase (cycloisomerase 2 family)